MSATDSKLTRAEIMGALHALSDELGKRGAMLGLFPADLFEKGKA